MASGVRSLRGVSSPGRSRMESNCCWPDSLSEIWMTRRQQSRNGKTPTPFQLKMHTRFIRVCLSPSILLPRTTVSVLSEPLMPSGSTRRKDEEGGGLQRLQRRQLAGWTLPAVGQVTTSLAMVWEAEFWVPCILGGSCR